MFSTSSFCFSSPLPVGAADHLLLELVRDVLGEPLGDHGRGRMAGAEPRQPGLADKIADNGLVLGGDLRGIEGDDEALSGGGDAVQLDVHGRAFEGIDSVKGST